MRKQNIETTRPQSKVSQIHGKLFETYMIKRFGLIPAKENDALWDAHHKNGTPISFKVTDLNSEHDLVLGDLFRQYEDVNEDFIICIGRWDTDKYNIVDFMITKVSIKKWKSYFNKESVQNYRNFIDSCKYFNKAYKDDRETWEKFRILCKERWEKSTPNIIRPRPRLNKSGSNRIQCAIRMRTYKQEFASTTKVYKFSSLTNDYHKFLLTNYIDFLDYATQEAMRKRTENMLDSIESKYKIKIDKEEKEEYKKVSLFDLI